MSGMPARVVQPNWRLVRVEVTRHCTSEWLSQKHITKAFLYYLVDANLHVHICSLTPLLEAWLAYADVEFESHEASEKDEGDSEIQLMNSEEPIEYFDTSLLDRMVHRPVSDFFEPDPESENPVEDMLEHFRGNPVCLGRGER